MTKDKKRQDNKMLKRFVISNVTPLGRWKIVHDHAVINIKIDQANKDNGVPDQKETFSQKSNENIVYKDKEDKFLLPYCM